MKGCTPCANVNGNGSGNGNGNGSAHYGRNSTPSTGDNMPYLFTYLLGLSLASIMAYFSIRKRNHNNHNN